MSAEDPTPAELLVEVNKAIRTLLLRRITSYRVYDVSYTYEQIGELRLLRRELQVEVSRTSGDRSTILLADLSRRPA